MSLQNVVFGKIIIIMITSATITIRHAWHMCHALIPLLYSFFRGASKTLKLL